MQEVVDIPVTKGNETEVRHGLVVSVEALAYVALLALALVLRVAELNSVPLMPTEVEQALAAWRVASPQASGDSVVSHSALLFALQSFSFTLMGGSEFAARIATVLAGAAVVISPALFRDLLGRGRALLLSLLLLCSPTLLLTSRFSSPALWSMLLAIVTLWGAWQYWQKRHSRYAIFAMVMGACAIFLTEPGGAILLLILVLAAFIARKLSRENRFSFDDEPEAKPILLSELPLQSGLLIAALVVVVIATGFMLYPSGLSAVGETLAGIPRGFAQPNDQPFIAFIVSVYYEPFMWLLSIITVIVLIRRGEFDFVERFLFVWALVGLVASLLFVGATPEHALWTTIPLTVLVSRLAIALMAVDTRPEFWHVPYWARWIMALASIALMCIFTMALHDFARTLMHSPDGTLTSINFQLSNLILLAIPVMFLIVVSLMVTSLWNTRTALQGIGIAMLTFTLITSLGSGWVASVTNAESPMEPFHTETSSADLFLLRDTLFDLAERETSGFPTMELVVEAPQNSVLAWVVRDFRNARFITDLNEARGEPIVLISSPVLPDLGGDYVGQDFTTGDSWDLQSLSPLDILAWWTQRQAGFVATNSNMLSTALLWLRQDVYNGIPMDQQFRG